MRVLVYCSWAVAAALQPQRALHAGCAQVTISMSTELPVVVRYHMADLGKLRCACSLSKWNSTCPAGMLREEACACAQLLPGAQAGGRR